MDKNYNEKKESNEGLIDITGIIDDLIKGAIRMKWRFLILIILCTGIFCGYKRLTYSPSYVASSTFTISSSISTEAMSTYIDNTSANQMAKTFPYILKSGILKNIVAQDLGVKTIPGKIKAEVMKDTNLFTLSVTASDPKMADKILQSVVDNYPSVAEFVIGSSQLTLMDETGVPTEPSNPFSFRHEILMGAIIGVVICFLLDLLFALGKNTVRKEEDFKKLFSVKSLGSMPHAKFNKRRKKVKELIVLDNPRLPRNFLESARSVRRRIERVSKESGMRSFLVTSAMPREGKSTVSANIALALSMKGYKVILVDADLRNPSTARVLGMKEKQIGTLEVIKGEASIDEAVQPYKDTGVMILAGSTPIQDTSSVLSGENMREFIKELEKRADFVIIDTPPSALLSDAAIVAQYVDGAIFVVRQDYTDIDRIVDGMEILSGSGVTIHGCILNDASTRSMETSHYSQGYHTKAGTI